MFNKSKILAPAVTFLVLGMAICLYSTFKFNKKLNRLAQSCTSVKENAIDQNALCDLKICYASIGGRAEFLKMMPDITKIKTLEIAPWFTPVLTGDNVKYFDVFDQETLTKKAIEDGQKTDRIPYMHYTEPTGDMSVIREKFQLIFSSHNIEHQIDLVRHLNQVADLLEEEGEFFIAIPDKRFSFDHYIAETPLSEVLAVYWQKPNAHSLQTILSMRCETAHNESQRHWKNDSGNAHYNTNPSCYFDALKEYNEAQGQYIDSHKWRFTPESFYTIVEELYKMNLQPLKVKRVFCTQQNSHEFYAILYKPRSIKNKK